MTTRVRVELGVQSNSALKPHALPFTQGLTKATYHLTAVSLTGLDDSACFNSPTDWEGACCLRAPRSLLVRKVFPSLLCLTCWP